MNNKPVRVWWHSRNKREKALLIMLVIILLALTGKWGVFEPLVNYQMQSQQKLFKAERELRWVESRRTDLEATGFRQNKKEGSLIQRIQTQLPEPLSIITSQDLGAGRLALTTGEQSLYPLIAWLVGLETQQNILVEKVVFNPEEKNIQILLRETD